jgi:hypothetical protein
VIEYDENEKNHVQNVDEVVMLLIQAKVFSELSNKLEFVMIVMELVKVLNMFVVIVIEKRE